MMEVTLEADFVASDMPAAAFSAFHEPTDALT